VAVQKAIDEAKKTQAVTECIICFGEINDPNDANMMPKCYHPMHATCYVAWAQSKARDMGDYTEQQPGVFPRTGACPCPMGQCEGHTAESFRVMCEERSNAIAQRGATDDGVADPATNGNGYMSMLRRKKQIFAIPGEEVLLSLLQADHEFSEQQREALSCVGFYVEARVPGRGFGGDNGVCNPPDMAKYNEMQKVQVRSLTPAARRVGDLAEFGLKGLCFNVEDLPDGWTWDTMPEGATLRLTEGNARHPGRGLKMNLTAEYRAANTHGAQAGEPNEDDVVMEEEAQPAAAEVAPGIEPAAEPLAAAEEVALGIEPAAEPLAAAAEVALGIEPAAEPLAAAAEVALGIEPAAEPLAAAEEVALGIEPAAEPLAAAEEVALGIEPVDQPLSAEEQARLIAIADAADAAAAEAVADAADAAAAQVGAHAAAPINLADLDMEEEEEAAGRRVRQRVMPAEPVAPGPEVGPLAVADGLEDAAARRAQLRAAAEGRMAAMQRRA
jgi:hypothetical protein